MGFYGGNKSIEKTQIVFDKIYSNRKAMDDSVRTDGVYNRRFVLVSYGENDDSISSNSAIDLAAYDQKTYNSTVWMKDFKDGNYKYTYVASLDSIAPTMKLNKLPAGSTLNLRTEGAGYVLDMPEPWGLEIRGVNENNEVTNDNVSVTTEGNNKVFTFNLPDVQAVNDAVKTLYERLEAFNNVAIEGIDVINQPKDSHANMVLTDLTYTYNAEESRGKINTVYTKPDDLRVSNNITLEDINKRYYKYRVKFDKTQWIVMQDGDITYYYQAKDEGTVIMPGQSPVTKNLASYLTSQSNLQCDGIIYVEATSDGTLQYANAATNKKNIDKNASYIYAFETKTGALAAYAYKEPKVDLLFAFTGSPIA